MNRYRTVTCTQPPYRANRSLPRPLLSCVPFAGEKYTHGWEHAASTLGRRGLWQGPETVSIIAGLAAPRRAGGGSMAALCVAAVSVLSAGAGCRRAGEVAPAGARSRPGGGECKARDGYGALLAPAGGGCPNAGSLVWGAIQQAGSGPSVSKTRGQECASRRLDERGRPTTGIRGCVPSARVACRPAAPWGTRHGRRAWRAGAAAACGGRGCS